MKSGLDSMVVALRKDPLDLSDVRSESDKHKPRLRTSVTAKTAKKKRLKIYVVVVLSALVLPMVVPFFTVHSGYYQYVQQDEHSLESKHALYTIIAAPQPHKSAAPPSHRTRNNKAPQTSRRTSASHVKNTYSKKKAKQGAAVGRCRGTVDVDQVCQYDLVCWDGEKFFVPNSTATLLPVHQRLREGTLYDAQGRQRVYNADVVGTISMSSISRTFWGSTLFLFVAFDNYVFGLGRLLASLEAAWDSISDPANALINVVVLPTSPPRHTTQSVDEMYSYFVNASQNATGEYEHLWHMKPTCFHNGTFGTSQTLLSFVATRALRLKAVQPINQSLDVNYRTGLTLRTRLFAGMGIRSAQLQAAVDDGRNKVLLVQRPTKRKILNMKELKAHFQETLNMEVQVADFDTMSVKEQAMACMGASVFVSVHGASMTNIFWLDTSAIVIEIFPYGFMKYTYQTLALRMRLQYFQYRNPFKELHYESTYTAEFTPLSRSFNRNLNQRINITDLDLTVLIDALRGRNFTATGRNLTVWTDKTATTTGEGPAARLSEVKDARPWPLLGEALQIWKENGHENGILAKESEEPRKERWGVEAGWPATLDSTRTSPRHYLLCPGSIRGLSSKLGCAKSSASGRCYQRPPANVIQGRASCLKMRESVRNTTGALPDARFEVWYDFHRASYRDHLQLQDDNKSSSSSSSSSKTDSSSSSSSSSNDNNESSSSSSSSSRSSKDNNESSSNNHNNNNNSNNNNNNNNSSSSSKGSESGYAPEVTIATQCDVSRFIKQIHNLVSIWEGPVVLAVLLNSPGEAREVAEALTPLVKRWVDVHLVVPRKWVAAGAVAMYPVNMMRNVAQQLVLTKWTFVLDSDLLPNARASVYNDGMRQVEQDYLPKYKADPCDCEGLHVFVPPALEVPKADMVPAPYCTAGDPVCMSKDSAVCNIRTGRLRPMHGYFLKAYYPTDYIQWISASKPYRIQYEFKYEPYFITHTGQPPFSEKFEGRGANKAQGLYEVYASGYTFHALPWGFVIDVPHSRRQRAAKMVDANHELKNFLALANELYNVGQAKALRASSHSKAPVWLLHHLNTFHAIQMKTDSGRSHVLDCTNSSGRPPTSTLIAAIRNQYLWVVASYKAKHDELFGGTTSTRAGAAGGSVVGNAFSGAPARVIYGAGNQTSNAGAWNHSSIAKIHGGMKLTNTSLIWERFQLVKALRKRQLDAQRLSETANT